MGYDKEAAGDTPNTLTSEPVLVQRNKLGIPTRAALFFSAALSLVFAAGSIPDSIFPTNTKTATQIAEQGDKAILEEYVAFIKPEEAKVTSGQIIINGNPDGLERYAYKSLGYNKERKFLFELISTYDRDGAFLTASLTTDRSKLSPVINTAINNAIATEGANSPKLPMLNEELLREAFIFPPENDTDKKFSCRSFVVGPGTEYKDTPESGLSTMCQVWMDKRTASEIKDWKFESPENLEFRTSIDPTGEVFFSVIDMRTLSCALPPFK